MARTKGYTEFMLRKAFYFHFLTGVGNLILNKPHYTENECVSFLGIYDASYLRKLLRPLKERFANDKDYAQKLIEEFKDVQRLVEVDESKPTYIEIVLENSLVDLQKSYQELCQYIKNKEATTQYTSVIEHLQQIFTTINTTQEETQSLKMDLEFIKIELKIIKDLICNINTSLNDILNEDDIDTTDTPTLNEYSIKKGIDVVDFYQL